jgi:hypothetical protein
MHEDCLSEVHLYQQAQGRHSKMVVILLLQPYVYVCKPHCHATLRVVGCSECLRGGCTNYQPDADYSGRNFKGMPLKVQGWQDCCALCRLAQDCAAWSSRMESDFVNCWLKPVANKYKSSPGEDRWAGVVPSPR